MEFQARGNPMPVFGRELQHALNKYVATIEEAVDVLVNNYLVCKTPASGH
jgi:hypothetical protein